MTMGKLSDMTPEEKIEKARITLAMDKPFYGYLLYRFKAVRPDTRIPTMATDGLYLHYNPEHIASRDFDFVKSDLAHAVGKCALGHPFRREQRDLELYNEASANVVNLMMIDDGGFKLEPGVPCDARFAGQSVEQVYSILLSEQPPQAQGGQGGSGQGEGEQSDQSGDGQQPAVGEKEEQDHAGDDDAQPEEQPQGQKDKPKPETGDEDGSEDEEHESDASGEQPGEQSDQRDESSKGEKSEKPRDVPGSAQSDVLDYGSLGEGDEQAPSEAEQQEAAEQWASASAAAVMQAEVAGHLSEGAARTVRDSFAETLSFEEYMMLFAKQLSRTDSSWMRRDRRFAAGELYLPGRRSIKVGKLVFGVDTSGSIDESILSRFQNAGRRVQEDLRPEETVVLFCDAEICGEERYADGDQLRFEKPDGGGGTSFVPFFTRIREMIEQGEEIAGMICVTDLEGTFPAEEDVADLPPVLWVSIEKGQAPFGETVYFHNK
jgi:predicted metal-dependent peptidase